MLSKRKYPFVGGPSNRGGRRQKKEDRRPGDPPIVHKGVKPYLRRFTTFFLPFLDAGLSASAACAAAKRAIGTR